MLFLLDLASPHVGADAAEPEAITTAAALRSATEWNIRNPRPLVLLGIVTYVDRVRELLFLQDDTGGVALRIPNLDAALRPGATVKVVSCGVLPCPPILPAFPLDPTNHEILPSFSIAGRPGTRYVDRFRALLLPPATGDYTFWIASDDSSQLWLSRDSNPAHAQKIAHTMKWTDPGEWTRLPTQKSDTIFLTAHHPCYIDALREQNLGDAHLAVAWQGPGLPRSIIATEYLEPFGAAAAERDVRKDASVTEREPPAATTNPPTSRGVLREVWSDCAISNIAELAPSIQNAQIFQVQDAAIIVVDPRETLPPPRAFAAEAVAKARDAFLWTEVSGAVQFASRSGHSLHLELAVANFILPVTVDDWPQQRPTPEHGAKVKLRGVAEPVRNADTAWVIGRLLVPSGNELELIASSPLWDVVPGVELSALAATRATVAANRLIKVRGTIVAQDGSRLTLRDVGTFRAFFSLDGKTWNQIGDPVSVEMGDAPYAGLAITSLSSEIVAKAEFSGLSGLPGPLQGVEIGNPGLRGGIVNEDGHISIEGAGGEIWAFSDRFFFAQARIQGNAEITARIERFAAPALDAKAGIMIRESLTPESQFVDVVACGTLRPSLQWRREGAGNRGNLYYAPLTDPPYWIRLTRQYAEVQVECAEPIDAKMGSLIEAIGRLPSDDTVAHIIDARIRETLPQSAIAPVPYRSRPLLSIKDLIETRENRLPDTLTMRGTVTFAGKVGPHYYLALQDHSAGIFVPVDDEESRYPLEAGQLVEIESDPVASHGALRADKVIDLGPGQLPEPIQHPSEFSLLRKGEGHWIEFEGVVQTVDEAGIATLGSSTGIFHSFVRGMNAKDWLELIDARVRLRGALTYRDPTSRLVLTPTPEQMALIEAAPSLAAIKPASISTAFGNDTFSTPLHRVKIAGTVTLQADKLVYIQNASGGAIVQMAGRTAAVGDVIEVIGFPDATRGTTRMLNYATISGVDGNAPVAAADATMADLRQGRYAGMLVRFEATVLGETDATDARILELQAGNQRLRAKLVAADGRRFGSIPDGTKVSITGVCIADASLTGWMGPLPSDSSFAPFELHVRSADDVVVVEHPSWWRIRRALHVVGILTVGLLFAFGWVHILRRRVNQRNIELGIAMADLKREAARSATLTERNRLAGELHDSLEQGLSGLLLQLDATAEQPTCPAEVRNGLMLAKRMASFSRTELHHAIWDMESDLLENADLAAAIERIAEQFGAGSPRIVCTVEGTPRRLIPMYEHNLLRIAQEAITNARKHASAATIVVTLTFTASTVVLQIKDDGKGFSPARVLTAKPGHFGLRSLRSRARRIGGKLNIQSTERDGTLIELNVSNPPSAPTAATASHDEDTRNVG